MTDAPNIDIHCNLGCGKITSCCMLSPDWSLKSQLESAMIAMRGHMLKTRGIESPKEGYPYD